MRIVRKPGGPTSSCGGGQGATKRSCLGVSGPEEEISARWGSGMLEESGLHRINSNEILISHNWSQWFGGGFVQ